MTPHARNAGSEPAGSGSGGSADAGEPVDTKAPPEPDERAERVGPAAPPPEHVEHAEHAEHVEHADHAEHAQHAEHTDEDHHLPFGRPGSRLSRSSPFYLGFFGTIGVLTAWFLGNLVLSARSVLALVVIALYLAIGLNPLVEWFVHRRIRRGFAVLIVFCFVIVAFGLVTLSIVPVVTEQVTLLVDQVPSWLDQLRGNRRIQQLDQDYDVINRLQVYITNGDLAERLFGGLLGVGRIVFSAVFSGFTVLILTLYFLGSLPTIKRAMYQLVPRSRRVRVTQLGDEILDRIGSYVAGQLLVAAVAGGMSFVFLTIVGLAEYSLALSIAVAVFGLIPLVGGFLGGAVVTAIAFLTDVQTGIAALVFYVVYQQIENYLIYPRIMERSVSVPGMVILVAALVGGSLLGIVGALLAVPTAAAIILLVREVVIPRQENA